MYNIIYYNIIIRTIIIILAIGNVLSKFGENAETRKL